MNAQAVNTTAAILYLMHPLHKDSRAISVKPYMAWIHAHKHTELKQNRLLTK